MPLTIGEKIKVVLRRRNKSITDLATLIGTSRQNLTNKFSRDNFSEREIHEIALALNCTVKNEFILNDTGEVI